MVPILLARDMGGAAFLVAMVMGPAHVLIRLVDATLWRDIGRLQAAPAAA